MWHDKRFFSCPLGRWVLKHRSFFFFFSPSTICILIGLLDFREHVMCFLSLANSTARCRRCFVAEFFQVYIGFLIVAIFAKTECYSPSNLLVRSAMCRTSATYQLSTCRKWYVHHSKHSMIILVTKPISITPVLSLARKTSEKILPVKTITQGKSKPLVENIFLYQSSHWGMSTLAVPVLFKLIPSMKLANEKLNIDFNKVT